MRRSAPGDHHFTATIHLQYRISGGGGNSTLDFLYLFLGNVVHSAGAFVAEVFTRTDIGEIIVND